MVGEFAAGLASLKTAVDIVQGLKDLSDKAAVSSAISELQSELMSAHQGSMTLVMQNAELTEQLRDAKDALRKADDFRANKDNYTLHRLGMGAHVYINKDSENPETSPWFCRHCFDVRHMLTPVNFLARGKDHTDRFKCQNCGSEFEDYTKS